MTPAYDYRATMVRVIDGDSYVLDVDLGFHVHKHVTVRLRGLDCPELSTPAGVEARTAVTLLFMGAALKGEPVLVRSYKDQQSFARWVCDVWIGETLLADLLRAGGHVKIPPA